MKTQLFTLITLCLVSLIGAEAQKATQVTTWKNVVSFSVDRNETYIVFSQRNESTGLEQAYESTKTNGTWSAPTPIASINNMASGATVGGLFLTDDNRRIYYHATYTGSTTGYDIFYVDRLNGTWGTPVRVEKLCSETDDTYPTVTVGEQGVYFLRHQVVSDEKTEKKEADKMTIYYAEKQTNNKWGKSNPINSAVTFGFAQDVRIARDGVSLLYSIRKSKKDKALPYYTRQTTKDVWLIPENILGVENGDYFSPQIAGNNLYYILGEDKKNRGGVIMSLPVPSAKYKDKSTVTESGTVVSLSTGKPIVAEILVKDPTTGSLVGRYSSKADDGSYHIVNIDNSNYLIDFRSSGYSFANYMPYYDGSGTRYVPETVELFDTISLAVNVFDSEIFRPVDGKVIAVRQTDKAIFRSTLARAGVYELRLPIGADYNIIATGKGFNETKFMFKIAGDIVFHKFERELAMSPLTRDVTVSVIDDKSLEDVPSEVFFDNQSRAEKITLAAGESAVKLREGDLYNITVTPPSGYSFKTTTFDLKTDDSKKINIGVQALVAGVSVQLNNIVFATGSAFLLPEAYAELDRVVELMKNNSDLMIQINAHTDNVGKDDYNLTLSNRRAASVIEYLVENGVNASNLKSKGYGSSKPLVPNTSDENRALNRRVEFSVL